jgi:GTP-dependent phosphoenolpyruvate carboxykinase
VSALTVLPTLNCVFVGQPDVPLNAPEGVPLSVRGWVAQVAALTQPDSIHWCDGSPAERDELRAEVTTASRSAVAAPHTVVCTLSREDADPGADWVDPVSMRRSLATRFDDCMRGRRLYVVPFSLGPLGGRLSRLVIQLTDSAEAVLALRDLTWLGAAALDRIKAGGYWLPVVHAGGPVDAGSQVALFPESREVWAWGGNGLSDGDCLGLAIAATLAADDRWLAEPLAVLRLTGPRGQVFHAAASGLDRVPWAMSFGEWMVETLGTRTAWLRPDPHGRLRGIAPQRAVPGSPAWDDPDGVPVDAILVCGTGAAVLPLVSEAYDWEHGVFTAAAMACPEGAVPTRRWAGWLDVGGRVDPSPRVFRLNTPGPGPGGSLATALEWVARRLAGEVDAVEGIAGLVPTDATPDGDAGHNAWTVEVDAISERFTRCGDGLPHVLEQQLRRLRERVSRVPRKEEARVRS